MKTSFTFTKLLFPVIALFIMSSCSKDDDIFYDLTGNWKVIYFMENYKIITKTDKNTWPDINNGDITANFTAAGSDGKGAISGIKVSNQYSGNYTMKENGKVAIGQIISTEINEPEWTKLFNISAAESYEIRNSKLIIYYNKGRNRIAFERI